MKLFRRSESVLLREYIRGCSYSFPSIPSAIESSLPSQIRSTRLFLPSFSKSLTSFPLHSEPPFSSKTPSFTNVTMSNVNDIPEEVQPLGPMFRRLPVEILLEIFMYTMMGSPFYKRNSPVDKKRFDIINNFRPFMKSRLAWKPYSMALMRTFYRENEFIFKHFSTPFNRASIWNNSNPPTLPPVVCRASLRRIQVHISLTDHYSIIMPGDYKPTTQAIRTLDDLFMYSSGARLLRSLTNPSTGFANLDSLDLTIYMDFMHDSEKVLALIKQAGFVVRARKVTITEPVRELDPTYYPGVAKLIAVELVE